MQRLFGSNTIIFFENVVSVVGVYLGFDLFPFVDGSKVVLMKIKSRLYYEK